MTANKFMNDQEINKAVHKALGLCWHEIETSCEKYGGMRTYTAECVKCHDPNLPEIDFQFEPTAEHYLPDYCNSLDAAMKFADKLIADGWVFTAGSDMVDVSLKFAVFEKFPAPDFTKRLRHSDPSLAKAICLAGLAAIDSTEQASTDREINV